MNRIHILMTGAGAPGGPGILKCLQMDASLHITVADKNPNAIGRFLNISGSFWQIPSASDDNFINQVLRYCLDNKVNVIFPLVTNELTKFSANKKLFLDFGIKILVSDFHSLTVSNNKALLYKHLHLNSIPTPQFRVVENSDFSGLVEAFYELGYPEKPIVFKPSVSNGSRGVRIVDDKINRIDLLFNHKPNSLYITYKEMTEILFGCSFPELVVSEYLPGEEYTVDTINYNGKNELVIPRLRKNIANGISVEGQFLKNEEIISYTLSILNCFDLHGPIGLQLKKAEDGTFKILEINPRIQGTSVSALGIGINIPLIAVYNEINEEKRISKLISNWGTNFSRYWQEIYY